MENAAPTSNCMRPRSGRSARWSHSEFEMHFDGKISLIVLVSTILSVCGRDDRPSQRLKQCHPVFDNHTLCYGAGILNSVKSFSGLLRKSRTGFSIYQSNIWIILLHTRCHADLEKLLCSMYAPICLKGHHFNRVYPCRELCHSVRDKCLPRLAIYGFEWPAMVDCAKFPSEQDASCIELTNSTENMVSKRKVKREREDRSLNQTILSDEEQSRKQKNCQVCVPKASLKALMKKFCEYSFVIKAKISNIFQKRKGAISIRLQHKSSILINAHLIKNSLTNLLTEIPCQCPILQNARSVSRGKWLLIGDVENGQFVVKFLTKWNRKRRKFRSLFQSLKSNPKLYCKHQPSLLKQIHSESLNNPDESQKRMRKRNRENYYSTNDNSYFSNGDRKK